ncbi:MAG: hypothetical protein ACUVXI_09995 [bacterium]
MSERREEIGRRKPSRWRRIVGYLLVSLGVLNIINFYSPVPIPTVGVVAFVAGAILVGCGVYLINWSDFDWIDLLKRRKGKSEKPQVKIDPMLPVRILKLAKEQGGILTVSTVAMELNVPLDHAEEGLEVCVGKGSAIPDFDLSRGQAITFYRFPEFVPPSRSGELNPQGVLPPQVPPDDDNGGSDRPS